ncbi:MAG TPA: hypothetical protein VF618_15090 [Thermoanaerobaculia bacterium]
MNLRWTPVAWRERVSAFERIAQANFGAAVDWWLDVSRWVVTITRHPQMGAAPPQTR